MCSNETPTNASPPRVPAMPFALDPAVAVSAAGARGTTTALLPIDQYRLQLYQYAVAERLRYPLLNPFPATLPCYPLFPRSLAPEEPKPQHSYIGLIAMAILSAPDVKLVLSDIYQHILDHYPYFRTRGPGWRNSIRHNLSLNDCFIKAGRSANGKGHYWAVHPANVDDFRKGDFRRRKAQRRVRKHMGLAVDEDGADSPSPPPLSVSPPSAATAASVAAVALLPAGTGSAASATTSVYQQVVAGSRAAAAAAASAAAAAAGAVTRKRQFDVASLLAPDSGEDTGGEEDIDVVSSDHHHHHHHHTHFMHHQNHQQQYLQHQQLLLQQHHQDNQLTQLQQQQQQQQQTQVRHNWPMFPIVNYYQALLHHQVRPSLQTVGNGVGSGATNHPQEPAANANIGDA